MLKRGLLLFFFWLSWSFIYADVVPKKYLITRAESAIKIDGILSDVAWNNAEIAGNFVQLEPMEGAAVSQETEVRVMYDNASIYIAAKMFDTSADSIYRQLGNRDEGPGLNADAFRFGFDPYNNRQSGYVFEITASGVQSELLDDDLTFDAVWQSAVTIQADGWSVEMRIPFAAIRFPNSDTQTWGVQFARLIRRNREYDQWTLTPKAMQNRMLYWGTMEGLSGVRPPLRLSLTPYFSIYGEKTPSLNSNNTSDYNYSYSGGADLKYGIDEKFTIDITALPDFSQVQSDNKVRNLSAFEQIFEERRPFFKEGTNLFSKGKLFYSRRIGKTPSGFYSISDQLLPGETIEKNPDKARLVNAIKLSGRTEHGLGIGLLNAVTANTYATINTTDGSKRKVLTEPLTNFNLFIFDQQLPNNCNIFFVNSNVMREGSARDADVSTLQGTFENKKHQYRITPRYSTSEIFQWIPDGDAPPKKVTKKGYQYSINVDKISGTSWYGAIYEEGSKNYDKNDLSYIFVNDYSTAQAYYSYNMFNPFWKYFRQGNVNVFLNRNGRLSEANKATQLTAGGSIFLLFNNNWSIYADGGAGLIDQLNYFEPRIDGRFWIIPKDNYASLNFTTNYNKKLAFDFGGRYYHIPDWKNVSLGYYVNPILRMSDKISIKVNNFYDVYHNDVGFAMLLSDSSVFGKRKIHTVTNSVSVRYLFKNDMSIALTGRHYWSAGKYNQYYNLETDGRILEIPAPSSPADFNASYFNIDLVYNWVFAPGSSFIVTYKNQISEDALYNELNYFRNLSRTLSLPQTNSISLKVLYWLDYQYFHHKS